MKNPPFKLPEFWWLVMGPDGISEMVHYHESIARSDFRAIYHARAFVVEMDITKSFPVMISEVTEEWSKKSAVMEKL